MAGYLLRGQIEPTSEPLRLRVDTQRVAPIPLPTEDPQHVAGGLVLAPGRVGVIFEANGVNVNPGAHLAVFDRDLEYRGSIPLEHVEYRITDACEPLADGTFWVINYFFPGDARQLDPPRRPRSSGGAAARAAATTASAWCAAAAAPLDLRRDPDLPARNWEAIVRLGDRGFLLMTDRYPSTLLAFVPLPDAAPSPPERRP